MSEQNISKSKQKRLQIEKARKDVKKKQNLIAFWSITIPLIIVLIVLAIVFYQKNSQGEYGKYLTSEGLIDVDEKEYVSIDTTSMNFAKADIEPTEEDIQIDIDSLLASHQTLSTDDSLTVNQGDKIHVTYNAILNGTTYASADESTGGMDMLIGNAFLGSDVDEALVGHKKGDNVTISVSYGEDYTDATLAGQVLTYHVTVEGIYTMPEFDDTFVREYLGEEADTAEGYRQMIYEEKYNNNLESAIYNFIDENAVSLKTPDDYIENAYKLMKRDEAETLAYYNSMYANYGLGSYNHLYELYGYESEAAYKEQMMIDLARESTYILAVQTIFHEAGLTNTPDEVRAYYMNEQGYSAEEYTSLVNEYTLNYVAPSSMNHQVMEYLKANVEIK